MLKRFGRWIGRELIGGIIAFVVIVGIFVIVAKLLH